MRRRRSPRGRSRSRRRRRRFRRRVYRASLQTLPVFIHLLSSFSSTGKTSPLMTTMKHHRLSFPVHVHTGGEKEIFSFDSFCQNSSKTQKRLQTRSRRHVLLRSMIFAGVAACARAEFLLLLLLLLLLLACLLACLRVKVNAQRVSGFSFFSNLKILTHAENQIKTHPPSRNLPAEKERTQSI